MAGFPAYQARGQVPPSQKTRTVLVGSPNNSLGLQVLSIMTVPYQQSVYVPPPRLPPTGCRPPYRAVIRTPRAQRQIPPSSRSDDVFGKAKQTLQNPKL
eukprot:4863498-Amphidinium_carterae.1